MKRGTGGWRHKDGFVPKSATSYGRTVEALRAKGFLTDDEPPRLTPEGNAHALQLTKDLKRLYAELAAEALNDAHVEEGL